MLSLYAATDLRRCHFLCDALRSMTVWLTDSIAARVSVINPAEPQERNPKFVITGTKINPECGGRVRDNGRCLTSGGRLLPLALFPDPRRYRRRPRRTRLADVARERG